MGADMLLECFWEEINDHGLPIKKPDWAKGFRKIKDLCKSYGVSGRIPDEIAHLGDGLEEATDDNLKSLEENLRSHLEDVRFAYAGNNREATSLEFRPYRIFVTGGPSHGDSPTELMNSISDLNSLEILEATGLNPQLPNTMQIVRTLVKQPAIQPLLMGMDKDLDEMLDLEMRKPKKGKRKCSGVSKRKRS